jgi:hypothetical protein
MERRITDLRNERRFGTRDIDDIESEIKQLQGEVTRLKRKHLNYFYFF